MWTFEQVFTFNNQEKRSAFAGHSSVLQRAAFASPLNIRFSASHSKDASGFVAFLRSMENMLTPPSLQPARACWLVILMQDNPHVDRRMDVGKFCKFNRWANYSSVCRCEWLQRGAICRDQSGISVHLYPRQFITTQLSSVEDLWEMQDYVF